MRKVIAWLCLLSVLTGGGYAGYRRWNREQPLSVRTVAVTSGPITLTIAATGTVRPTTTVAVGCEVSGAISELAVDYNDRVVKDQIIARINPEIFEAELQQAEADVAAAQASEQLANVKLREAARQLERTKGLRSRGAGSDNELAAHQAAHDAEVAQLALAEAQVQRAKSIKLLAEIKLRRAVIRSPIDGVVLTRDVDEGQTVVAALRTPILYTLAPDLSNMVVHAHVSEADIGGVRTPQPVTFTVDAYPLRKFTGTVQQVRHAARDIDNVVTYDVVIDAPNPDRLLKPGMTASVTIEILRQPSVLRIASAALHFRPPLSIEQRDALTADLVSPTATFVPAAPSGQPRHIDLVPSVQRVLWEYDPIGAAWQPVPVLTGVIEGQVTELRAGAHEGQSFVVDAVVPTPGLSLSDALRLTQPENRRL